MTAKRTHGFTLTEEFVNEYSIHRNYENQAGDIISFDQYASENMQMSVDTEHTKHYKIFISDIEVNVADGGVTKKMFWVNDGYFFDLTCFNNIDIEAMTKIVASIK